MSDTGNPGSSISWGGVVFVALAAGALGIWGGPFVMSFFGEPPDPTPEMVTTNVDRSAQRLIQTPPAPSASDSEPAGDPGPVPASTDPLADAALREIWDRRAEEEARLAERRRLASESALTPPVTDVADRIRRRQEQRAQDRAAALQGSSAPVGTPVGAGTAGLATGSSGVGPPPSGPPDAAPPTHVLARGSVIPAVLETALDSDLPGLVRARVSEDVYDTLTGSHVLIPRGAQLVGTYGERARSGQRRLFVTWTDLRLPGGMPVDLEDFSTLGADGAAGVKGKRRTGLLAALGAAVLFDLAGNATQILTGSEAREESDLAALIAGATGNATSRVADRYMSGLIDGGPRFRVKAGTIMNVLVEEDITLPAQETP